MDTTQSGGMLIVDMQKRIAELEQENERLRAECGLRQIQGYHEGMEQRNFLKPGDKVRLIDGEILTVKSLEFNEFVPVERSEYVKKTKIADIVEYADD